MVRHVRQASFLAGALAAVALVATACSSQGSTSSGGSQGGTSSGGAGSGGNTIKIGVVASITGTEASFGVPQLNGIIARIDAQNAAGGVHGAKLQLITADDASTSAQALSAAQSLVARGVFGIISADTVNDGAIEPYLRSQGIPLAVLNGSSVCGVKEDTNTFNGISCLNPTFPLVTTTADFLKSIGATNVGTAAYAIPAPLAAAKSAHMGAERVGLKAGYANYNVQFSGENYTADGIAMAQSGIDAWAPSLAPDAEVAMLNAAKAAGAKIKYFLMGTEGSALFAGKGATALNGAYFTTPFVPAIINSPATQYYKDALAKYAHIPAGNVLGENDFNVADGWLGADVFVEGLQVAGPNPTRPGFIKNLRAVTDYTAGGLAIGKMNMSMRGVNAPNSGGPNNCAYFFQYTDQTLKLVGSGPVCGTLFS